MVRVFSFVELIESIYYISLFNFPMAVTDYIIKGMGYAGTAGMVWGWIIGMFFIQCVAMSMAELCSSMPTRLVTKPNQDYNPSYTVY